MRSSYRSVHSNGRGRGTGGGRGSGRDIGDRERDGVRDGGDRSKFRPVANGSSDVYTTPAPETVSIPRKVISENGGNFVHDNTQPPLTEQVITSLRVAVLTIMAPTMGWTKHDIRTKSLISKWPNPKPVSLTPEVANQIVREDIQLWFPQRKSTSSRSTEKKTTPRTSTSQPAGISHTLT